jgi:hypothetical protein
MHKKCEMICPDLLAGRLVGDGAYKDGDPETPQLCLYGHW